ncbi:MAG TPA: diguanylate phosphodiesterase, partial [Gammaproteobacteria bacterium]|nr:diguanylate phosphodiesterase [Gammaproteobacteria bacterium]
MTQTLIARQPILDVEQKVFGYELLYREPGSPDRAPTGAGDAATSSVLVDVFSSLDVDRFLGGHQAFINLTRNTLLQLAAHPLGVGKLVVEVLENVPADGAVEEAIRQLRQKG